MGSPQESRRQFLRRAGLTVAASGAVSHLGVSVASARTPAPAPPDPQRIARAYAAGNFLLTLDGVKCGFVRSVEGGGVQAEVINETTGASYFVKKHIGQPKYEDVTFDLDFRLGKNIYDWISASWMADYSRKNGSIVAADYQMNATSEREFKNALVTETTIPAMDATSKEPAYMTIKIAPEYTRLGKSSGKLSMAMSKGDQKLWLPTNFKLDIDGLDCSRVTKVDAFTIKQKTVGNQVGEARDYLKEPGKLEFPNLRISISEISAPSWIDWHEDFVIKGNNGEPQEKNGSLIFYTPNLKQELGRIKFYHLGIFRLGGPSSESAAQVQQLTAELYCERMEFQYNPQVVS
ncbi:MAG: phage tail protein [Terriglobia bacterium]